MLDFFADSAITVAASRRVMNVSLGSSSTFVSGGSPLRATSGGAPERSTDFASLARRANAWLASSAYSDTVWTLCSTSAPFDGASSRKPAVTSVTDSS